MGAPKGPSKSCEESPSLLQCCRRCIELSAEREKQQPHDGLSAEKAAAHSSSSAAAATTAAATTTATAAAAAAVIWPLTPAAVQQQQQLLLQTTQHGPEGERRLRH